MEYDSESSYEGRLRDLEAPEEIPSRHRSQQNEQSHQIVESASWHPLENATAQPKVPFGIVNRSLSSQVMEYYRKYSQNSNLEQYFSIPGSSATSEEIKYYYSLYEINPKPSDNGQKYRDFNLKTCVPKERRKWVRPPLVGQSSGNDASGMYVRPLADPQSPPPHDISRITPETIPEERSECQETPTDVTERKVSSPTSSVTSHKPLEWDSGADVGYFANTPNNKQDNKKLSTIERMALARGCSAALRLDPEGTTESGKIQSGRISSKSLMKPEANSTAIVENISGSESEIEITPIVKNHLPGVITGNDIKSDEKKIRRCLNDENQAKNTICDTPKSSGLFKVPLGPLGSPTKTRKVTPVNFDADMSPLKKSSSMNIIAMPGVKLPLKRSQSDLNLHLGDKNKALPRLIFNSTSSIATVVNKPITCDKVIQTTLNISQESVGVQVSVLDEERPPLPKRGTSLNQKPGNLQSILKNSQNTYKIQRNDTTTQTSKSKESKSSQSEETRNSSSETDSSTTPQHDDTVNVPGRANSFEYFPGHIYENVPNGSTSHVSTVSTGRSNSTMPNTSSSIDEKLWGESDSLVRDLERSVNILKSLVDANKCDKTVKKRLIHHVVKRLVTAKYTDDKIEHNLEENVPWNPDDARKKVYRAEIIQALAKKQNTTDSSDDWKFQKSKEKTATRTLKEIINLESSASEKFLPNTELDGRKARMGLRVEDCDRSTPSEQNKSESSECFLPQRNYTKNMFCIKKKCDTTTTNSSPDQNLNPEPNDWRLPTTVSERNFELRRCSNSDSGDSKLVSYAEMEKKNQLIWITNEISHLSNLKKLLEQPKKLERGKTSPRKTKTRGGCIHTEQKGPSTSDCLNENWSSHCNLAVIPKEKYKKTRNSFTQTANDVGESFSKTSNGVNVTESQMSAKSINIGLQTLPSLFSSGVSFDSSGQTLEQRTDRRNDCRNDRQNDCRNDRQNDYRNDQRNVRQNGHRNDCQNEQRNDQRTDQRNVRQNGHRNDYQDQRNVRQNFRNEKNVCHCHHHHNSKIAPCSKNIPLSPSKPRDQNFYRQDSTDEICENFAMLNLPRNGDENSKQKETKNHVNASRSKFPCENSQNCRHSSFKSEEEEISEKSKKEKQKICEYCHGEKVNTSRCESEESGEREKLQDDASLSEFSQKSFKSQQKTTSSEDCICDYRQDRKKNCFCSERRENCNYPPRVELLQRKEQTRPYYLTNSNEKKQSRIVVEQTNRKCRCEKDCVCSVNDERLKHREEEEKREERRKRREGKNDERLKMTPEKSCKCCRTCGTMYQKNRKCDCRINYPKAVAYELTFMEESRERKNVSKSENEEIIRGLRKVSSANSLPFTARSGTCSCEDGKNLAQNKEKKITLQECLASNKPRFLDNIETRQQYLNEISHLREMKKEKRVQLLAMASSSSLLKPTKLTKSTNHVQRKLTTADMKERLRRRYMRLNEVRSKRRQLEKQEEFRRNNLMAKIFGKKLQQKVLQGQVDLSQSVSVISNL
ncbi:uncharacterized protein LOC122502932 [Leptopilina heterotoma]|uniref:uncharacterized protein LOC122502932 n=1 Tax=Leptopilina heterotoma TaxID=63436 RepID=UPI001CA94609|nr:uncharacterized protein LOC122502932 [Leptopilina heterotoma]